MKTALVGLLAPCMLFVACERSAIPPDNEATVTSPGAIPQPPPPTTPTLDSAVAHLAGTEGRPVRGELRLTQVDGGVTVMGEISGLGDGTVHGFHVHEHGDCFAPDASSAGGHFNPADAPHGGPDSPRKHLGDMPNITADKGGRAEISTRIDGATLHDSGPNNLVGKAVVVHANADDYETQPSGNSGDRIACGVVE